MCAPKIHLLPSILSQSKRWRYAVVIVMLWWCARYPHKSALLRIYIPILQLLLLVSRYVHMAVVSNEPCESTLTRWKRSEICFFNFNLFGNYRRRVLDSSTHIVVEKSFPCFHVIPDQQTLTHTYGLPESIYDFYLLLLLLLTRFFCCELLISWYSLSQSQSHFGLALSVCQSVSRIQINCVTIWSESVKSKWLCTDS